MTDITPLCIAVLSLVAIIVTVYLVPWLRSKTTKEQREEINAWVKIAVRAAEQLFGGSGRGTEKKQYVIDFMLEFLAKRKLTINMDELDKMLEAAVLELNKGVL